MKKNLIIATVVALILAGIIIINLPLDKSRAAEGVNFGGNMIWDPVNNFLGLGVSNPQVALDIAGDEILSGTLTATNLKATALTNSNCDVKADTSGNVYCGTDAGGGGAAWGQITGTLSDQSDLQTALIARGYTLSVQALTSSPADSVDRFFGKLPKAPVNSGGISKIYIRRTGTIKVAEIYSYSGTAGTNENWSLYIRKNNTTDYLIATVGAAANERIFSNTSLDIPIVAGDYIEIKMTNPLWATNPATSIFGGYIYIE